MRDVVLVSLHFCISQCRGLHYVKTAMRLEQSEPRKNIIVIITIIIVIITIILSLIIGIRTAIMTLAWIYPRTHSFDGATFS